MKKKLSPYYFGFYIVTMFLFLIFPKQLAGNIYITISYLAVSLVLLYLIYVIKKPKTE